MITEADAKKFLMVIESPSGHQFYISKVKGEQNFINMVMARNIKYMKQWMELQRAVHNP